MNRINLSIGLGLALVAWSAPAESQRRRSPPSVYSTPDSPGAVRGVGTESQDIVSMSDQMMRDMLTIPELMNASTPPRVIIDAKHFRNESSEIIDKALITDRIRVHLSRSGRGRVRFIGREYADAIELERDLKDQGRVDVGTTGRTQAQAGADYRLVGRIGTRDAIDPRSGVKERYS
ncbi:MAG: hypothetical protein AVDCRST_MAG93-285, partial [uncultured Chloroflexia bacterium]